MRDLNHIIRTSRNAHLRYACGFAQWLKPVTLAHPGETDRLRVELLDELYETFATQMVYAQNTGDECAELFMILYMEAEEDLLRRFEDTESAGHYACYSSSRLRLAYESVVGVEIMDILTGLNAADV